MSSLASRQHFHLMQQRQFSWNCLLASLMFFLLASPVRCQSQPYRSPAADSNARVPGVAVRYFTLSGSPTQVPFPGFMCLFVFLRPRKSAHCLDADSTFRQFAQQQHHRSQHFLPSVLRLAVCQQPAGHQCRCSVYWISCLPVAWKMDCVGEL